MRFPLHLGRGSATIWWDKLTIIASLTFIATLLLHLPLFRLPYFWDEAGYFIPAARDLLLHFQWTPTSTLTNAHPPLVMAWLALSWKILGYHAVVTRVAMLLVAIFTLVGVFRLAREVTNPTVALASMIMTALFPVFFAQSTLAHLDMAAAGFTIWGLTDYVRDRYPHATIWFAFAALSKETAILAPVALFAWEVLGITLRQTRWRKYFLFRASSLRALWLLISVLPLVFWFGYHYRHTGFLFGNPEFLRYNVSATLNPIRFIAALALRLWELFGYMNLFVLTIVTALAMTRPALALDEAERNGNGPQATHRARIAVPTQIVFGVVVAAYTVVLALIGGAVLARYLLPVYPLVVIVCVSTLWRRLPWWPAFVGVVCIGFVLGLVINPPYHFAPEDNLAYADFVRLHQQAARYVEEHPPAQRVLTAWPASDELTKPYLGYVTRSIPIVRIDDFSFPQLMAARNEASRYDEAFLFSTKYEPSTGFLIRSALWERLQKKYFDYHVDLPPAIAAQMLEGHVVYQQQRGGLWVSILLMDRALNARVGRGPRDSRIGD